MARDEREVTSATLQRPHAFARPAGRARRRCRGLDVMFTRRAASP